MSSARGPATEISLTLLVCAWVYLPAMADRVSTITKPDPASISTFFRRVCRALADDNRKESRVRKFIAQATKELSLVPNNPDLYFARGLALWRLEKYADALKDLDKGLSLSHQKTEVIVYVARGECHIDAGDKEKALTDFDTAARLYPDSSLALTRQAQIYCEMNKYHKALPIVSRLIKIEPTKKYHYELRARIYSNLKKYELQIRDLTTAIKLRGANREDFKLAEDYSNRAVAYEKLGKHAEAAKDRAERDSMVRHANPYSN
jgi:tetratricopeptide (TPR) repeat protein